MYMSFPFVVGRALSVKCNCTLPPAVQTQQLQHQECNASIFAFNTSYNIKTKQFSSCLQTVYFDILYTSFQLTIIQLRGLSFLLCFV